MSKNKTYCGVGPVPKGKSRGSMKECVELGQVRYFGVKKVDPKLLETLENKGNKTSRGILFSKITKIKGQIKKLKSKIETTKDKNEKAELESKLKKLADEGNQMVKEFNSKEPAKKTKIAPKHISLKPTQGLSEAMKMKFLPHHPDYPRIAEEFKKQQKKSEQKKKKVIKLTKGVADALDFIKGHGGFSMLPKNTPYKYEYLLVNKVYDEIYHVLDRNEGEDEADQYMAELDNLSSSFGRWNTLKKKDIDGLIADISVLHNSVSDQYGIDEEFSGKDLEKALIIYEKMQKGGCRIRKCRKR